METRLTESSAGDGRVIGLSISATIVRGVSVIADERAAPSVRAVAESDIDAAADTSLAVAEVHAALIEGEPAVPVAVAATFEGGGTGPALETEATAQRLAEDRARAIRWTTDGELGIVADAADVDHLTEVLDGTGVAISRIELAEAASHRCRDHGRLGAMVDRLPAPARLRNVQVSSSLLRSPGLASPEDLAPAIGAALGAINDAPGDLRVTVANTAAPETDPGAVAGWAVEPTRAPVDFAAPASQADSRLQMAVVGLLVLSALLLVALIVL